MDVMNVIDVGVMDVGEQGARRIALMENDSKERFVSKAAKERGEIINLKRERGIPDDTCLCGRQIEPGRLQLNLPNCRACAFKEQSCTPCNTSHRW